jgi:hypothetical protein
MELSCQLFVIFDSFRRMDSEMDRFFKLFAALLLTSVVACSGDSPTDGGDTPATTTRSVEIPNVFSTQSSATHIASAHGMTTSSLVQLVEIRKIRLTVYEVPSNKVLFQKTYDVDPTQTKWTIDFTAPVGATVKLVSELMSVTDGAAHVEYSGKAGPLTITDCGNNCAPIPMQNYPGPVDNLEVTSVSLSVDTASVNEGGTLQLTGTALPARTTYVGVWSSLNTSNATVNQSGLVTALAAGTAKIVYAVGAMRDTATITIRATCAAKAYTLGTSVNGSWADGDCLAASGGRRYDMYEFTLTQQATFRAQVTGPAGRRISLRRSGAQGYLQLMASDASMPPATNPLEVDYVLPAGSYVFEIANPDASTFGSYTLNTVLNPTLSCNPLIYTTFGVTITDQLTSTDCPGVVSGVEDRYIMLPDSGQRVNMTVTSTAIAPVLVFRDDRQGPASPTLTSDVRFTPGHTARTAYTTTFGGFHEIIVNNATAALGAYTLTIAQGNAANTCENSPTTIGGSITAFWNSSDCKAGTQLVDTYPFTVTSQTVVQATESSTLNPKILGVFTSGGKEVLEWLGGAGDFTANWYLAPGQYELRATAPASAAGTPYTLKTVNGPTRLACATNSTSGNITLTGQTLETTDCAFNGRFEDRLTLWVDAGKELVVDMTGVDFAPAAIIRDPSTTPGVFLTRARRDGPGSVTTAVTATVGGYYQVIFSSDIANATGAYSGSITIH